jgi:hypothetical protein
MTAFVLLAFLLAIGPLALKYGADSRRPSDRGWIGSHRPR